MTNIPFIKVPEMKTAFAQAIWDKEKGRWKVSLVLNEIARLAATNEQVFVQDAHEFEIEDCDEWVIADAILEANGICTGSRRLP